MGGRRALFRRSPGLASRQDPALGVHRQHARLPQPAPPVPGFVLPRPDALASDRWLVPGSPRTGRARPADAAHPAGPRRGPGSARRSAGTGLATLPARTAELILTARAQMKYLAGDAQASVAILYPGLPVAVQPEPGRLRGHKRRAAPGTILVSGGRPRLSPRSGSGRDIGLLDRFGRSVDRGSRLGAQGTARSRRDEWYATRSRFRALVRRALLAKAVDDIAAGETPLRCRGRAGLAAGPGSGHPLPQPIAMGRSGR